MAEYSKYINGERTIIAAGAITPLYCVGYDFKETDGAGEAIIGIADYNSGSDYASGGSVNIIFSGICDAIAGDTVVAGDPLTTNSSGKLVKLANLSATVPTGATPVTSTSATPAMTIAGGATPSVLVGYCLIGGGDNDIISVRLV